MPVRRKRVMRRKRNMRRKTRSSMRKGRKGNTVPDGVYSEKLTYEFELVPGAGGGLTNGTMQFHWTHSLDQLGGSNTIVAGVGGNLQNNQFNQCLGMFREYMITGLKIEWRPYILQQNPTTGAIYQCKGIGVGTVMNYSGAAVNPISITEFRGALDYKMYSPEKPFKRYYKVGAWSRRNDISWRPTASAAANAYTWGTADCITCLQVD